MKYFLTLNCEDTIVMTEAGSMDIRLEADHESRCLVFINDVSTTSFYDVCSGWIMKGESPIITSMSLTDKETGEEVYSSTYWNKLSLLESNFYQNGIDHVVTLIHEEQLPVNE